MPVLYSINYKTNKFINNVFIYFIIDFHIA